MRLLPLLLAVFLCGAPALAQSSPKEIVTSFYKDYLKALESNPSGWVQALMASQTGHMEKPLMDDLNRLASGDPNKGEPFLDFDPFSNSQMGLDSFTVGEPVLRQGLAYVPVAVHLNRDPGPEKVRLRFVLRDQGAGWRIANVAYPAENGMQAWDLKTMLKDALQGL